MIVLKILFLFLPLVLVNAQGGGRFGFGRSNFRRPVLRPWARPTVSPIPDTPMPTEKSMSTEKTTPRVSESPRGKPDLSTIYPVYAFPVTPVPSLSRTPAHGRFWPRPVFGPKPTAAVSNSPVENTTPALEIVTPVKGIAYPEYPPVALTNHIKETGTEGPSNRPLTGRPFATDHVAYNSHQNFDPRARISPFMSNNVNENNENADKQPEKVYNNDDLKTTTESPSTAKETIGSIVDANTGPAENYSPTVTLPSTTTEFKMDAFSSTSKASLVDDHTKYENPSSLNSDGPIRPYTSESKPPTVLSSTPKIIIVPAISATSNSPFTYNNNNDFSNFNSRSRVPPYMSHNLNIPSEIKSEYTSGPPLTPTEKTITAVTPETTTKEAKTYTIEPSTNEQFVFTAKIPSKIVSTTEDIPARTNGYNSVTHGLDGYKENYYEQSTDAPKVFSTSTKEPELYTLPTTTKAPLINEQKMYDNNAFRSKLPAVSTIKEIETTKTSSESSEKYEVSIYPDHANSNHKIIYNDQSSKNGPILNSNPTTKIEEHTTPTTSKLVIIDDHKNYAPTSDSPMEYTSQHKTITESSMNSDSYSSVRSVYRDNKEEDYYQQPGAPPIININKSEQSYEASYHKTGTPQTELPKAVVTYHSNNQRYSKTTTTPKPSLRYTTKQPKNSYADKVHDVSNFKCEEDGFYAIPNQCDDFIECKSGVPLQNSCPDGLHFNPAAKHSEFPCAYPSEVKCESNAVSRIAEPTSECPRRYGYFSLPTGGCDKYIMCQEGLATVMSCPAGLAFSVATSSCDWPSNVPGCIPDVFQGFTCPEPELDDDGNPTHSINKYRYQKSCKKYIACQKGHPRLLSCDTGLSFDENTESCVDESDIFDCT